MTLRGDRLREIREQHGLSQRELARLCGFGNEQIFRYETGRSDITGRHLKILADKLGVSTDYLLGHEPYPTVPSADLSQPERDIINAYRRKDWRNLLRLMADHLGD